MKQLFFLLSATILLSSCHFFSGKRIHGDGNITTVSYTETGFESIDVSGAIHVILRQDSLFSVNVETDNNLHEFIEVSNDGKTLRIHTRRNTNLDPSEEIKVFVSAPNYKNLEAAGACSYTSENRIAGNEKIAIDMSGACTATLSLNAPETNIELSGASSVTISGETKNLVIDGSGSTHVKAYELLSENADVEMSGAGSAEIFASVKIDASVSGATHVFYKGNATVNANSSGAGSVSKAN